MSHPLPSIRQWVRLQNALRVANGDGELTPIQRLMRYGKQSYQPVTNRDQWAWCEDLRQLRLRALMRAGLNNMKARIRYRLACDDASATAKLCLDCQPEERIERRKVKARDRYIKHRTVALQSEQLRAVAH